MVGKILVEVGFIQEIILLFFSVKEVVFLFVKFFGVDLIFGLEMKFIGEVMGVGDSFVEVFVKVQLGVSEIFLIVGCVFISVCEDDKLFVVQVVGDLVVLGFEVVVIVGIVCVIEVVGLLVCCVNKVIEGCLYVVDMIKNDEVILIINIIEGWQFIVDFYFIC